MQDYLFIHITKGHVVELHVALELRVGDAAVLMRVLPGPKAGSLRAFLQGAVRLLFRIDQGDIAVVHLRLFVDHPENPLSACQGHDNGVELLGHLHEGLGEALGKLQVSGHDAQGDAADIRYREKAAQNSRQHKLQVAQVADDGAHHVGEGVGLCSAFIKAVVECVELLLGDALVIKDFNDPLPVHALFNKARHVGNIELLAHEVFAAVAADFFGDQQEHADHDHREDGKQRAERQHRNKGDNNGEKRHEHLRDGLVDHLAQGVGVIGVEAHNRAVGVLVKIADGQGLHVLKHFIAHTLEHALADFDHQTGVDKRGQHARQEDGPQNSQRRVQLGEIGIRVANERDNEVVEQKLQGERNRNRGNGADENADKHGDKLRLISAGHISEQAPAGLQGLLIDAFVPFFIHRRRLLSLGIHRPHGKLRWFSVARRKCRCR